MRSIDVVADANVALKWFHAEGEEEVEPVHEVLRRYRAHEIALYVLDLTIYEVGNALLRGQSRTPADRVALVLGSLREICPTIAPDEEDLQLACALASEHELTLYDATYAAVAARRNATLVTHDRRLLDSGLGQRPNELIAAWEEEEEEEEEKKKKSTGAKDA
jgi:predicted nucleic acid-binding protein